MNNNTIPNTFQEQYNSIHGKSHKLGHVQLIWLHVNYRLVSLIKNNNLRFSFCPLVTVWQYISHTVTPSNHLRGKQHISVHVYMYKQQRVVYNVVVQYYEWDFLIVTVVATAVTMWETGMGGLCPLYLYYKHTFERPEFSWAWTGCFSMAGSSWSFCLCQIMYRQGTWHVNIHPSNMICTEIVVWLKSSA